MNGHDVQKRMKALKDQYTKIIVSNFTDKHAQALSIINEIVQLMEICPHSDEKGNFCQDKQCPYCGKKLR